MITGENGVVDKASNASVKNREAKAKEEISMAWTGVNGDYNTEWIENTNLNKVEYFSEEEGKIRLNKYLADTGVITNGPTYSEGQYTLTYKTNDTGMEYIFSIDESGNITKKCGIILSKTTTKIKQDDEEQLEAILDGITGNIIWESSAPELVSVSNNGTIKALADSGSAVITARVDETIYKATCTVTILQKITSISTEDINIEEGETHQIIILTTPSGENLENISYTYNSSNTSKVTVNESGIVTGVAPGSAQVTITGTKDNNEKIITTCTITVELAPLQVGSTVIYKPGGKYDWNKTYATANETGLMKLQTIASGNVNSGYINASVISWRVLKIINEEVQLVPSTINTTAKVTLQGAPGYNNGVNLLNEACSSLYSNTSKGITARSINLNDIEESLNKAGVDENNDDILDWVKSRDNYNGGYAKYNNQATSIFPKNNSYYPLIYGEEKNRVVNGITTNNGLEQSDELVSKKGRTNSGATDGYIQATTNIQPYQTYYNFGTNKTLKKRLGSVYSKILLPGGSWTSYWVASRSIYIWSDYCSFQLFSVKPDNLPLGSLFDSKHSANSADNYLFPVVSLNFELIEENEDGTGYEVK